MKYQVMFITSFLIVGLVGCGGGGSSSNNDSQSDADSQTEQEEETMVEGGTPSEPSQMSFDEINEINADSFVNHFKVTAQPGDELIITASLSSSIDLTKSTRCSGSSRVYTGIRIDDSIRSCTQHFRHIFEEPGEHIIKFGYPDDNHGGYRAALIPVGQQPTLLETSGEGGTPQLLGSIDLEGENQIYGTTFFNHYGYRGKEGETIYLQAYVHPAEADMTVTRCSAGTAYNRRDTFGWAVLNGDHTESTASLFTCSDYLEHTFEEAGVFRFNFRSTVNGTGFFNATVTSSPL